MLILALVICEHFVMSFLVNDYIRTYINFNSQQTDIMMISKDRVSVNVLNVAYPFELTVQKTDQTLYTYVLPLLMFYREVSVICFSYKVTLCRIQLG